jgi:predicted nucleic acid-binding protein
VAGTLVDSNVLLDLFTEDPRWCDWSEAKLADALDRGATLINPIVYAEISIGFERIEELEQALPDELEREALPWEAAFLAGKMLHRISARGRPETLAAAGFLYRCPRRRDRACAIDARSPSLSVVLPTPRADLALHIA